MLLQFLSLTIHRAVCSQTRRSRRNAATIEMMATVLFSIRRAELNAARFLFSEVMERRKLAIFSRDSLAFDKERWLSSRRRTPGKASLLDSQVRRSDVRMRRHYQNRAGRVSHHLLGDAPNQNVCETGEPMR